MEHSRQIYSKFRKSEYLKKNMLKFRRPSPNDTYNSFNTKGMKHLTRLYLGLRHLWDHKFRHSFLDLLNPCGFDIEMSSHFSLHCPNFINERSLLLNSVSRVNKDKWPSCDTSVIKLVLYGDDS